MTDKPIKKKRNRLVRFVLYFWMGLLALSVFILLLFAGISAGMLGKLPDIQQLENPQTFLASEVYSQDSVLLGKFYYENRSNATYEELSPNLINALIATEDTRFRKHSGIDVRGLVRVFFKTVILRQSSSGGGSTITQQLSLNLFSNARANTLTGRVKQKLKEWVISIQLEKRYTKEEIITMYLNTVQFSGNSYGIKSAAKMFFNTSTDKLTVDQAAVLVGVLKAISKYNPKMNYDNSLARRNTVMSQMKKYGYLTADKYDSLKKLPIELNYQAGTHNEGQATYFREYLRQYLNAQEPSRDDYIDKYSYEIDKYYWENSPFYGWIHKNKKADGTTYDLYRDGLKIFVTIDSRLQRHAEHAVDEHMQDLQKKFNAHWKNSAPWGTDKDFIPTAIKRTERYRQMKADGVDEAGIKKAFDTKAKMRVYSYHGEIDTVMSPLDSVKYYKYFAQTGFMSMDPKTGAIKAWVGGINHKFFKFDHVNIHATRQVGSTFKPFVYSKYVSETKDICKKMPNTRNSIILDDGTVWEPQNSDGKETESEPLWRALALSMNNVTVNIMKQLDPNAPKVVRQMAQSMGIKNHLEDVYSICLGVSNLSVYEMVGAFATFANKGFYTEPYFVAKIVDKSGTLITGNVMPATHEAMNEKTAFLMLKMMQRVTTGGTGTRLRSMYGIDYSIPVAGKTGTTQNNSDGWFIGVTPDLVSGAWVGWDDMKIHFRSTDLGQGAAMALPIFAYYMKDVYADKKLNISKGDFDKPKDTDGLVFDCKKEAEEDEHNIDPHSLFDR